MKLEELAKERKRFVLTVGLVGLTATVLTGALMGTRYLKGYHEAKLQEKVQKCIKEEGKYISNARDIEYFGMRVSECLDRDKK